MKRNISKLIIAYLAAYFLFCPVPLVFAEETAVYSHKTTSENILPNGITVILHETRKSPVVSINILVKCGSSTEGKYAGGGISHFVEHMLFKSGDEKETNKALREIKSFGGSINGFTSRDYTVYTVMAHREFAMQAITILKDFIFFPDFDAIEIDKERQVILDEIRKNKDDNASCLSDLLWSSVFKENHYKYPIIGCEDLFTRLTRDDVEYYFYHNYSPDNIIISVSGDIESKAVYAEIVKTFSDVKRYFVSGSPDYAEPPQLSGRFRTENRRIKLAHGALSYRSVSINDPALYGLDALAAILGGGEGSILTKELRDNKKLVYFISCNNAALKKSGIFSIYFITESANTGPVISEIQRILNDIKERGVQDADLEKAKKMAAVDYMESLQTAEGIGVDIILSKALTDDYNFSQKYLERLCRVSVEDVKAAAGIYLNESQLNLALLMPESSTPENEIPAGKNTNGGGRDISHYILPSGARVIICEDRSLPICTISAMFQGGVRFETEANNGVSNLVSRLMLDGTIERSEEEIKSAVESLGGSIRSISGMNSLCITMDIASSDWKKGFEILSDVVKHPSFSDDKIDKEKTLALAAIKERDDNIVESGLLLFRENFFKASPYSRPVLGHTAIIEALKKDAILNYYNSFVAPSLMVITAAGDIDKESFIAEVKREFGSAKNTDIKLPEIPAYRKIESKEAIAGSMEREQSIILIGFPAAKIADPDRYAFELIDSIMSGSDGRLFNEVRNRLGVSYSLGSIFMPGIEPGCHIFYAVASAKNISLAKDAILKEIKKLKSELIPEKELDAAKRYLIAKNITDLEKNSSINLRMAMDELYGLGYNNFEMYKDRVLAVTAGQIKRVASQYFDTDNCLIVTIYGKPH